MGFFPVVQDKCPAIRYVFLLFTGNAEEYLWHVPCTFFGRKRPEFWFEEAEAGYIASAGEMKIFKITERLDTELLGKSHDPKDPKLGEMVKYHPRDYESAQVVILGCPEDEGVERNRGIAGARNGPTEIRRALYCLALHEAIHSQSLFDLGDIITGATLERTHDRLRKVVRRILEDGKLAVVLGGGNDISYPDCAALTEVKKDILVFNIDKHFDVRDLSPRNSGTAYRQLLEESLIDPERFYEMGSEEFANSPAYRNYLERKGVHIYSLDEMRWQGISALFQNILHEDGYDGLFWGFDLDVVRDADAPGVSARYPTGLTAREMIQIAEIAGKATDFGILEVTEVNPELDIDNRTGKLAAILIHTFLSARKKEKRH
jgi:formiminoglutamase